MRRPGDVNRPKRGVAAPPLDPLPVQGGDGCCYWPGGGIPNGPGDASCGTIAESYRAGVPLRSSVLRMTDASPLRVPGTGVGRGFNGVGEVDGAERGVIAPPPARRAVRGGDGCCFVAAGGILDGPGDASLV